jgi:hypothetical protein
MASCCGDHPTVYETGFSNASPKVGAPALPFPAWPPAALAPAAPVAADPGTTSGVAT